ncbi:MAG: hypothetical protein Q7U40_06960 [Desulfatirhabdiaceae bacterium]|nr:hypothetical protein [Desulfatirhabdiaceae bacterium]
MSSSISVTIEPISFGDALATMRILKSLLPATAVTTITACAEQTKDQVVYETVKVLNVDDTRVSSEIKVEHPSQTTLKDYKASVISKGKPIELSAFSEDASAWNWKKPTPVHAKIYRQGATHEFRHVFVSKGRIFGRKKNQGGEADPGPVYAWMKYVARAQDHRYPIERLQTVRLQDIQDKPQLIDPVTEDGAEAVITEYKKAVEEVFANVW